MIYLDNAATTLIKPPAVHHAVLQAMETMASPGRGGHPPAMRAAETVYDCREAAAKLFHVPEPEQVVFTMNATHGLNLAIRSLVRPGDTVAVSGFEHNSVTRPLHALGAKIQIAGDRLFDPEGFLTQFDQALNGAKAAVCTHVSNAFGYVLPIGRVAALCRARNVPLVIDASQSAGILDLDFEYLGAAFIAMPGHKALFGPQGTGILLCGEPGTPLLLGGSGSESIRQQMPDSLPDRLEAGTHNVCGIAGLLAGIRYVTQKGTDEILRHEKTLLEQMKGELTGSGYELFTGADQAGVISLTKPEKNCEELAAELSEHGICVRAGLHCAPFAHRTAGTLDTGTVRFSFSPFVTPGEITAACEILKHLS